MLNYITSELHKTYSPLFRPDVLPAVREERLAYLQRRYALLEERLEGNKYLFGDRFTVADAYLFAVTNWARGVKLDLSGFPNLQAFQKRVGSRKSVLKAMRAEGLIKDAGPERADAA
jgi:glutathione S-transferase